jgi:hypothetical protein
MDYASIFLPKIGVIVSGAGRYLGGWGCAKMEVGGPMTVEEAIPGNSKTAAGKAGGGVGVRGLSEVPARP